jgi:hypothetical protein
MSHRGLRLRIAALAPHIDALMQRQSVTSVHSQHCGEAGSVM